MGGGQGSPSSLGRRLSGPWGVRGGLARRLRHQTRKPRPWAAWAAQPASGDGARAGGLRPAPGPGRPPRRPAGPPPQLGHGGRGVRRFCSCVKQRSSQTRPRPREKLVGSRRPRLTPPWVWGRGTGRLPPLYANGPSPRPVQNPGPTISGGQRRGGPGGRGAPPPPPDPGPAAGGGPSPGGPGLDCRHAHVCRSARTRSGSFSLIGPTRPRLTPACTSPSVPPQPPPRPVGEQPLPHPSVPRGGGAERRQQELPRYQIRLLLSSA